MCVDDAMAIFFALKSPELDVIGLTTIFGNVQTVTATVNALHLVTMITHSLHLLLINKMECSCPTSSKIFDCSSSGSADMEHPLHQLKGHVPILKDSSQYA